MMEWIGMIMGWVAMGMGCRDHGMGCHDGMAWAWGGGCTRYHGRSRKTVEPRMVFTDQADIACTKREAP